MQNFVYVAANTTAGQWEFAVSSVALGSISLQSLPLPVVISSTSASIVLPNAAYHKVKADICRKVACFDRTDVVGFNCDEAPEHGFANLTFALNDVDVTVTSEIYVRRVYRKNSETKCYLKMQGGDGNSVVLGLPFMQSYYLLFDYESGRVGLAQHLTSYYYRKATQIKPYFLHIYSASVRGYIWGIKIARMLGCIG